MYRKMRLTAPADRFDELLAAARHTDLPLDDYGVDSEQGAEKYGWPLVGDGSAFVLPVVDDTKLTGPQVETLIREAHAALTGQDASWITFAKSYVALPDALDVTWYRAVMPMVEALHDAEDSFDIERVLVLREQLAGTLDAGRQVANVHTASLMDDLTMLGILPVAGE